MLASGVPALAALSTRGLMVCRRAGHTSPAGMVLLRLIAATKRLALINGLNKQVFSNSPRSEVRTVSLWPGCLAVLDSSLQIILVPVIRL